MNDPKEKDRREAKQRIHYEVTVWQKVTYPILKLQRQEEDMCFRKGNWSSLCADYGFWKDKLH